MGSCAELRQLPEKKKNRRDGNAHVIRLATPSFLLSSSLEAHLDPICEGGGEPILGSSVEATSSSGLKNEFLLARSAKEGASFMSSYVAGLGVCGNCLQVHK